jgi:hypothetical protein
MVPTTDRNEYKHWSVGRCGGGSSSGEDLVGSSRSCLDQIVDLERDVCSQFLQWAYLVGDLVMSSVPHWNGEDIMINLALYNQYAQLF